MKKTTAWLVGLSLLLCVGLALPGCGTLDKEFVAAVDASWQVIGPEYTSYVAADPKLDVATKLTRQRTAELLTKLIEEGKKHP